MNRSQIKSIVLSRGWAEVEKLLRDSFDSIKINETKDVNEVGKQYLAKQMAIKELNNVLAICQRVSKDEVKKDIVYK